MRWLYTAVFVVFMVAMLIFAVQNIGTVVVTFLGLSITAPMAIIIVVVYILGMLTGSSLFAAIRRYLRPKTH